MGIYDFVALLIVTTDVVKMSKALYVIVLATAIFVYMIACTEEVLIYHIEKHIDNYQEHFSF